MAVGTGNISLQDVTTEIYEDTDIGRNLVSCFADATGLFDPTYEGSKNSLANFRGYVHFLIKSTLISISSSTITSVACGLTATETVYHDGTGLLPASGDNIYTDAEGTTIFIGTGRWYKGEGNRLLEINLNGIVTNTFDCSV